MPFFDAKKYLAALLVLSYLLLGSGLARALVWCVDGDGHSHVEINPAGNCQDSCEDADEPDVWTSHGLEAPLDAGDCRDVSLLSSHTQNSRPEQVEAPEDLSSIPPVAFHRATNSTHLQARLLHAAQPPPPPLSPILAALQTVVLRH